MPKNRLVRLALPGLALASVVACSTGLAQRSALQSVVEEPTPGAICAPLGKAGLASFSWEVVQNTSEAPVEITRVELIEVASADGEDPGELMVDEWFLTSMDWTGGSVGRGPLRDPGDARLSTTVGPGEEPMLNFTVRAGKAIEAMHSMRPRVVYTREGRRGEASVDLPWVVKVAPTGRSC